MEQFNIFAEPESKAEQKYTQKIKIPVYEVRGVKPSVWELFDTRKTSRLISEINASNVTEDEKKFLIAAARRHTEFNYGKIADFYAHSSPEMQRLIEHSALVIIDFDKAIELGYVRLSDEITQQYLKDYYDEQ